MSELINANMTGNMGNMAHMGHVHHTGTHHPGEVTNMDQHMGHDMSGGNMENNGHGGTAELHGSHPLYFSFNYPVTVLFFEWFITTPSHLAASCVGIFLVAVLYEGLKVMREHLLGNVKPGEKMRRQTYASRIFNLRHLLQAFLQIVQTTIGMLLMLIYMTFNFWLAFSVSAGSGVGYFLFAWANKCVAMDGNCHGM